MKRNCFASYAIFSKPTRCENGDSDESASS
jgi:hypothetical protein